MRRAAADYGVARMLRRNLAGALRRCSLLNRARKQAALCALLCIGVVPAFAQASDGMAVFRRQCSSCHGRQAEGGRAPNLTHSSLGDSDLSRVIAGGVSGTEMAAYLSRLS